jgi:hypothetical protein
LKVTTEVFPMKIAAALFLALCTVASYPAHAQSGTVRSDAPLAKPQDWKAISPVFFANDPGPKIYFGLQTSWIPGERRTGMFRYKMGAAPLIPAVYSVKDIAAYAGSAITVRIKRISACNIYLELYDKDDFKLRKILIQFNYGVNEQAEINSLDANNAVQMSASEYRQLSSWSIAWNCPTEP